MIFPISIFEAFILWKKVDRSETFGISCVPYSCPGTLIYSINFDRNLIFIEISSSEEDNLHRIDRVTLILLNIIIICFSYMSSTFEIRLHNWYSE